MKNTTGGKGSKSMARKLSGIHAQVRTTFRESTCDEELYGIVTKMLGNGMCYVQTHGHEKLLCHIRSKFSGRSKRNNFIAIGSYVMIGLREWESTIKNCDLLDIYDPLYIPDLSLFPRVNNTGGNGNGTMNEDENEEDEIIFKLTDPDEDIDISNI